jgi:carboxylate-amine ligase
VPETELIREYLEFVKDEVEELESGKAIGYIHQMLRQGSGADRQLNVWRETGSLRAVVDYMALETKAGL